VSTIPGPAPSVLFRAAAIRPDSVQGSVPPTQWKHGMLIGGIAGGVGGAALGLAVGSLNETQGSWLGPALAGGAGGALLGGMIGALIGGQFPKHTRSPADSSSTPQ
jgi:hypothetical protein